MDTDRYDVEVEGIEAGYGENLVLHGVDLRIHRGQVTCVLGPSGCGKSTLLRTMLGMIAPRNGSVRLLGRDILAMEREELSKFLTAVGVTFQQGALFGSRTIGENVAAPLQEHTDLSDALIESLVELKLGMVSMADAIHRMPGELSGGMQKRAAIARALALDPRILFFDEPSAGLDPLTAASLDELIVYLNRSLECTIVVITHEMQSCLRIADRIVFLHDGRVTETGTKEEITRSANPRIQRFLQASGAD